MAQFLLFIANLRISSTILLMATGLSTMNFPKKNSGLSPVSISVGVAFTDRKKSSRFIFKDADKALYLVKENSRRGCAIY
ncbi:hypothetical protein [uncultured Gemmiger sp.]|uniref:hypothetical protein n=1 Tax=uncultured Gemmiger sp. TaxID=1623490 RepID=UPI0025EC5992|nr:hypothetical protein [uncultured Gemmiger sp.]